MPRRIRVRDSRDTALVEIDGHDVRFVESGAVLSLTVEGRRVVATDGSTAWRAIAVIDRDVIWVDLDGEVFECRVDARGSSAAADDALTAPMPATVVRIAVEPGQRVARGDTLVALEAMKMELPIRAPRDGVVHAIRCTVGALVDAGTLLVELS